MNHASIRPYFLTSVILVMLVLTFSLFRPFLVALALAAIFSVILRPLFKRLLRAMPRWRGLVAFFSLLIGLICIMVPVSFISIELFSQTQNVYSSVAAPASLVRIQGAADHVADAFDRKAPGSGDYIRNIPQNVRGYSRQALAWLLAHAADAFSRVLEVLLDFFIFLMALYYFLKEEHATHAALLRLSPLTDEETDTLLTRLAHTVDSVVKGHLTMAFLQGVLACVSFTIFGVPNALLWGTMAGFAALVPGVGTSLVLIPTIIYLFVAGHTVHGIGLLIWSVIVVVFIDNFLNPRLVGGRASIHPLLILLSVLGGIALFGAAGVFLGPLTVSLLIGLLSIYAPQDSKEAK
ncbi:MAG: AI-2E family transporter [Patescibacteria group bacterium]